MLSSLFIRGTTLVAIVVLSVLMLVGCSSGGGTSQAAPATDSVNIDMPSNVTSLDPASDPYLVDNQIIGLTSASLFRFAQGSATKTEPVLATSLQADATNSRYTLTLKKGLKFSDGSPLTAKDVVSSLTRLRDTPGPNQGDVGALTGIIATSDDIISFSLAHPDADLAQTLALPSTGIIPAAAATDANYFDDNPAFSGAYVPTNDVKGDEYTLKRNPDFGGEKPKIAKLHFKVVQDAVTTATRLQGGDIDFAPSLPQESASQLSGDLTAKTVNKVSSLFLVPNNRAGSLFSDVRVRQALAWAIDRKALGRVVYGDKVQVQSGPYPVPADFPQPVSVYPKQDIARAKTLLTGTACENGCSFTASYFASSAESEGRAAAVLQEMLQPLGMKIQVQPVEDQQFIQNSLNGSFDLNVVESGGFNVPASFTGALDTGATQCIYSGCMRDGFAQEEQALLAAVDPATQKTASQKVLESFEAWTPIVPVAGTVLDYGVKTSLVRVIGIQPNGELWITGQ